MIRARMMTNENAMKQSDATRPTTRTLVRIGVLAAMGLMLAACGGAESRKARFIEKGETFQAEHNWEKARLEYRNALQIDPKNMHVRLRAAQVAEKLGDFREAVGLYQSVVQADSANTVARASLAKLYLFGGLQQESSKLVDEGLAVKSDDAGLLTVRGAIRRQAGDEGGALQDAEAAIAQAPADENAVALLASIYAQKSRVPDAISLIDRALNLEPKSVDLRIIKAQLLLDLQNPKDAEKALAEVIELEPGNLNHRYRLAQLHLIQKDIDSAESILRKAMESAPADVGAKLALANMIATYRSVEAAEKSLAELLSADSGNLQLKMAHAQFFDTHRKLPEAKRVYAEVVEIDGSKRYGLEARNKLAAIAIRESRIDEASNLIEAVLKESPRDNDALVMRANLSQLKGDPTAAVADLRAVLRDQPNTQPILRALAQAHLANKELSLAEETLRNAIRSDPRDIATRLQLAQLLIQNDRAADAQPVVDQLVLEQPGDPAALEAAFRVQMARRDLARARVSANTIQTLRPAAPTGFYLAGLVEQVDGKLDAARAAYEKARELAPDALEPLTALIRIDLEQSKADRAIERVDAVIAANRQSAPAHNLKGEVLSSLKRHEEAISEFRLAMQLAPKWWTPYRGIAVTEVLAGRPEAGVTAYKQGIAATQAAPLITDLTELYERQGMIDAAIAEYEAWLKREPQADIATNNLSMLLITHKSNDKSSLDKAAKLSERLQNSNNAAFLDTYAWVRYVRGEFAAAVPPLQRAVDLAPREPMLRARLGLAQYKAGHAEAAKKNLESALAESTSFIGADDAKAALSTLQKST